ncbi:hypothetical protein B0I35DRAFT_459523 [Stachybotrys elegans]|uniref:NmrA-like domain-containing protein n=1 Tax=Stachybotrys elegans TaxID=80388 RepID=A0A8K0SX88_9HYPO|nr:hypothetical protein B0I35DRAFT_459523 [Stachybotrys elegans]
MAACLGVINLAVLHSSVLVPSTNPAIVPAADQSSFIMTSTQGRKIALIGATGNIGTPTLNALLAKKIHTITVILRPESTATLPPDVIVKKGALDDEAFLTSALEGQDVLLVQAAISVMELQDGFIRAAAAAKVEYVLPTEFGSDPEARFIDQFELLVQKKARKQLIEELGVSSWIGVVTNQWLDFCLPYGLYAINSKDRKATLFDGGNTKFVTATYGRIGQAVAELLSLPKEELAAYKNKHLYVTSFHITQRELLDSIQRATGTTDEDWEIVSASSDEIEKKYLETAQKGDQESWMFTFAMYHYRQGWGGDFSHKSDMSKFGFEQEDLDETVKRVLGL